MADEHVEHAECYGVDVGYVSRLLQAGRERMLPCWLSQLESGSVIDRAVFGSDQQFARTAFYNYVVRPEGRFHCMIATLFSSRSHRLHLVVGKPLHQPGFDTQDIRQLQYMLPLIQENMHVRAELSKSEATARGAFGISEAWQQPIIVTDSQGTVYYANRYARRLFDTRNILLVGADLRLRSNTPSNNEKLRQAFASVLRTGKYKVAVTQNSLNANELRLIFRRAETDATGTLCSPIWIVITAETDEDEITEERLATVRQQHGLTERETNLLLHLTQGSHLKDACRQLGITYNTGRSHLRQIFGKTQTHRQIELMQLWASGDL